MGETMKPAATVVALFISLFATAQVWAPIGATWHYNFMAGPSIGCETRTYVSDSLIDGQICQRIEVLNISYDQLDQELDTIESTILTREVDGVVTLQAFSGQPVTAWDTLYWFSAPVGARWISPGSAGKDCPGYSGQVEVLSIQEQSISGLIVEVRTLGQLGENGDVLFEGLEMIDRLGTPLMFLPVTCPVGELFGATVSYHDDLWDGFDSGETSNCDRIPNSLREPQGAQLHTLSFGPDGRTLTIQATGGSGGLYALYDVHGTSIQHGRYSGGGTTIAVGDLPAANYFIRLTTNTGQHEVLKFHVP